MSYQPPTTSNWKGRVSGREAYQHEVVHCLPLADLSPQESKAAAILGYACDEGVRRNMGRTGAKLGPDVIRERLAKIANHPGSFSSLQDLGNIACDGDDLEGAQEELTAAVESLLRNNYFPILLGGGHDIAYAHYSGIRKYVGDQRVGIINFDAHFDLRKFEGAGNSGTPFHQIATQCDQLQLPFHYMCLGVEPLSNIPELFATADSLGVQYIRREDFVMSNYEDISQKVSQFLESIDFLYLTIDLDGFSAAAAPGVSAPSPFGFEVPLVLRILNELAQSDKLISMDVAELCPEYDQSGQTAKLAAYLVAFMYQNIGYKSEI